MVVLLVILAGCGWESRLLFQGPGNRSVRLLQPRFATGTAIEVASCRGNDCENVHVTRGDVRISFAEVYWDTNGRNFALFTCGEPRIRFAYDTAAQREVPFEDFSAAVGTQIAQAYGLPAGSDPLEWACSLPGVRSFLRKYPNLAR